MKQLLPLLLIIFWGCNTKERQRIDISGEWTVALDSLNKGHEEEWFTKVIEHGTEIFLPSTLDENKLGTKVIKTPDMSRDNLFELSRRYTYIGPAWYQRKVSVPEEWKGKSIELELERVIWKSEVWIDGKYKGKDNSLVSAHKINLGELTPGEHDITICIDNSRQYHLFDSKGVRAINQNHDYSHAYTETTQIIWNGVLGNMTLSPSASYNINHTRINTDIQNKSVTIKVEGKGNENRLFFDVLDTANQVLYTKEVLSKNQFEVTFKEDFDLWNEFNPTLYKLRISDENNILREDFFGLREVVAKGNDIFINNEKTFFRGTLECAIFPLTGHTPLDEKGWKKVFETSKAYGLNHIRFHSWCPPEAAFRVADKMGFYLQVELPNWSLEYGIDPNMVEWMEKEADRIIESYGNHPSFCLMSMGNELEGDFDLLNGLVKKLQKEDNRHLYTVSTFSFEQPHGTIPEPADDYWITQWSKDGWIRGQGVFDAYPPQFNIDFSKSLSFVDVPVITHEVGQYSVFPNMKEIDKYNGVLQPLNFEAIRNDMKAKGILNRADDYLKSSGQLAKILYKEEIERALKTKEISGIQMLDLHDFPGQGMALVGILDAFWDSKGIISPDGFKEFCSELVPLLDFDKAVFSNTETFEGTIKMANYWKDLSQQNVKWKVIDCVDNSVIKNGVIENKNIKRGVNTIASIQFELNSILQPKKLDIEIEISNTSYKNKWSIWVYPETSLLDHESIIITDNWSKAEKALNNGKDVLFTSNLKKTKGVEGKFVPVFWSPILFPDQAGTMGILCDPNHKVFNNFPTEYHTNWQWWDICKKSKAAQIEGLQVDPLVTVVDNFYKNRDLSTLFEAKVGKGKLLVSTINLYELPKERKVARSLYNSIITYMKSDDFNPEKEEKLSNIQRKLAL
ncbi:glycoside hydrolase family 2 [Flammeovirga sp. MY04]|uniref:sugar-binding domain-containing protein n=1 Tax=Flammeovirga sp. MY04 TaxID=1191459 RepID=UPI0008063443|nr:sugar-binding domain-containing protein [Flammeovirga sp. MY04]ANQ51651.1 glycoside hydrolase family 2 [Flammeovirga sp. MY04]